MIIVFDKQTLKIVGLCKTKADVEKQFGVKQSNLHNYLNKKKYAGKGLNSLNGYYFIDKPDFVDTDEEWEVLEMKAEIITDIKNKTFIQNFDNILIDLIINKILKVKNPTLLHPS